MIHLQISPLNRVAQLFLWNTFSFIGVYSKENCHILHWMFTQVSISDLEMFMFGFLLANDEVLNEI